MYHPVLETDAEEHEFLEIHNRGGEALALGGWQIGGGVRFRFPDGTTLAPGGYLVVARSRARLLELERYALDPAVVLGDYQGQLDNDGERLVLQDAGGRLVDDLTYDDLAPWPEAADALGVGRGLAARERAAARAPPLHGALARATRSARPERLAGQLGGLAAGRGDAGTAQQPGRVRPWRWSRRSPCGPPGARRTIESRDRVLVQVRFGGGQVQAPELEWFADDIERDDEPTARAGAARRRGERHRGASRPAGEHHPPLPGVGRSRPRRRGDLPAAGRSPPLARGLRAPARHRPHPQLPPVHPPGRLAAAVREPGRGAGAGQPGRRHPAASSAPSTRAGTRACRRCWWWAARSYDIQARYQGSRGNRFSGPRADRHDPLAGGGGHPRGAAPVPAAELALQLRPAPALPGQARQRAQLQPVQAARSVLPGLLRPGRPTRCSRRWACPRRATSYVRLLHQRRLLPLHAAAGARRRGHAGARTTARTTRSATCSSRPGPAGTRGRSASATRARCAATAATPSTSATPSPTSGRPTRTRAPGSGDVRALIEELHAARAEGLPALRAFFERHFDLARLTDYMVVRNWLSAWDDVWQNHYLYRRADGTLDGAAHRHGQPLRVRRPRRRTTARSSRA